MEITLNGNIGVTGIEARVCLDIATRQAAGKKKYPTELALNRAKLRARLQHAYEVTLNHAGAQAGAPWQGGVGTLYPGKGGTPLVPFFYEGGHGMAPGESDLIVKFFHEHPAP